MNVLVIDGQGGQLGGQIIKSLKANFEKLDITAGVSNAVMSNIIDDVVCKLKLIVK